jgi:cytochrome c peroxidase
MSPILKRVFVAFLLGGLTACHQLDETQTGADVKQAGEMTAQNQSPEAQLRDHILALGVHTPDPGNILPMDDPKVILGQALFFDKIVSGDQNIACSTCHHPAFGTSDGLPTPIGVGGISLGPQRAASDGFIIPRNSPDLFNRGVALWSTMFWDARISAAAVYFESPAGTELPNGLDSVLAVQAMFPPTSRHEMRGEAGNNDIADVEDDNIQGIWASITERILAIDTYVSMFEAAYPDVATDAIGFQHAANAMAAFEVSAFTRLNAPFDQFLAGDDAAMSEKQLRGAELFFQESGCVSCHSGPLFTDQESHAIAAPQLGPGKDAETRFDLGRMLETNDEKDRYAFRTPPLRNVELTGPYMHSGAYRTLEDAIRHHITPAESLRTYTGSHLIAAHADTVITDPDAQNAMIEAIDHSISGCADLTEDNVEDLVAFLQSLTDESARNMTDLIPTSVPSGLDVE